MPNTQKAILITRNRANEAVKPQPPADLWQQMQKVAQEHNGGLRYYPTKPEGAFDAADVREQMGIGQTLANKWLRKWVTKGAVELIGIGPSNCKYFRFK